jgi:AcrR family transcriptional regulator
MMARAFSEQEKTLIKQKLIDSYEICLAKYGVQKINIDELVRMAGISKGSFYLFYDSKEMLFVDVLDRANERIKNAIYNTIEDPKKVPPKELLKTLILAIFEQMRKTPWVLQLDDSEYESTLRRIPHEVLIQHTSRDHTDVSEVLKHFHIDIKLDIDTVTAIYRTLFFSVLYQDLIGEHYDEAIRVITDGIISQLL